MLNILKPLTFTKLGKQKKVILSTFKAITCPILECANTIWSIIISNTNIKKLQTIQNSALHIDTRCTQDTNTQDLHDKTKILPMDTNLKFHATQLKQFTQAQTHILQDLNACSDPPRNMKITIFHNHEHPNTIILEPNKTLEECREKLKHIQTIIQTIILSHT